MRKITDQALEDRGFSPFTYRSSITGEDITEYYIHLNNITIEADKNKSFRMWSYGTEPHDINVETVEELDVLLKVLGRKEVSNA